MEPGIRDVVGIGFGPSGLALAIALRELGKSAPEHAVSAAFVERQARFGWHRDMLLPSAKMQVSFLKDLVTFRNPMSPHSFVAYLHAAGRLAQFVNNDDVLPTRREFHSYLEWAAAGYAGSVDYGVAATGIRLPGGDPRAGHLEIDVTDGAGSRQLRAANVVISTGLVPAMPAGIAAGDRVWHSSTFLSRFTAADPATLRRIAVLGAGQSAAEIVRFLRTALPAATVYAILPSYGYAVADSTPFANQVFDPGAVDDYHGAGPGGRDAFWRYHRNTNYAVVDDEVLRDLHRMAYEDEVTGDRRLTLLRLSRVHAIRRTAGGVRLRLSSQLDAEHTELDADLAICATGYRPMQPTGLLGDLEGHLRRDEAGRYLVTRDHRLVTGDEVPWAVYLQGGTEHTHGLSASLLSNVAVRAGEIAGSILGRVRVPAF
ncbi:SidA/IucD/PvdA family monooxygenase [Actinoplanes oblitus]|uniref:L-lysine N6-monooxygenase MbtG n=1 Tax=Actinoplanes oblitus TaxID=3040509 RepID=A0ABY8WSE1_9ACTN|nr:SidA/IucD/PvdA family monooxygenase [Actinoplanes oblitus]WIN00807.1 SidA/IucD/PvdA family monooxygenase [Actinoplanes oblitus]